VQGVRARATITGDPGFPVNRGALCIKGWTAAETLDHPDRLLAPLARDGRGRLAPAHPVGVGGEVGQRQPQPPRPGRHQATGQRPGDGGHLPRGQHTLRDDRQLRRRSDHQHGAGRHSKFERERHYSGRWRR